MAAGGGSRRRPGRASHRPPTGGAALPTGPVTTATGTVELVRDRDDPSGVTVVVNGVPSSHLDLADPTRLDFEYMQQMAVVLDRAGTPGGPLRVVHLGAAGCTLARYVDATRPGSRQLAVELDASLAELVRAWFDLPRSPALRIRAGDARAELARCADHGADVVVRDVFAGDTTPDHVRTVEFTRDVARVLAPGGVYLANCADRPPLGVARAELATLRSVFADVVAFAEPAQLRGRRYGNLVLAGSDTAGLLRSPGVERAIRSLPAPTRVLAGPELEAFVGDARPLRDPDGPEAPSQVGTRPPAGSDDVRADGPAPPAGPSGPA